MFTFKNGELIKNAYVEINGVQYEVQMPEYAGQTPLSSENMNRMQEELLKIMFPVGSSYVTQSPTTNPNTVLGFGTWERTSKVLLGVDENDINMNEVGKTGGEKEHVLTVEELPNHAHEGLYQKDNNWSGFVNNGAGSGTVGYQAGTSPVEGINIEMTTGKTGENQPMNIMMPYEIVGYMWIRRA